jgi:dephospho-CoA kinase
MVREIVTGTPVPSNVRNVDCTEATQVARVVARSGITAEQVRAIIGAQIPRDRRLALADDVIDNEGGPERLAEAVARLDRLYRTLART